MMHLITFIAATFSQNQNSTLAVTSPGRQPTAHNTIAPSQAEVAVKVNGTVYDIDLKESFVDIKAESGHCNRGGCLIFVPQSKFSININTIDANALTTPQVSWMRACVRAPVCT